MKYVKHSSGEAQYWNDSTKAIGTFNTVSNYLRFLVPFVFLPIFLFFSFSANSKAGESMMSRIAELKSPLPETLNFENGQENGELKTVEMVNRRDNSTCVFMSCPKAASEPAASEVVNEIARGGGLPDPKRFGTAQFFSPQLSVTVKKQGELEVAGKKMYYLLGDRVRLPGSEWSKDEKTGRPVPGHVFFGAIDSVSQVDHKSPAYKFIIIDRTGFSPDLSVKDVQSITELVQAI